MKVVRSAVRTDTASRHAAAQDALHHIRERVREAHRAQFDDLLHEAQATHRMRDERGFHTDTLAIGVARRAVLAAGERAAAVTAVPPHQSAMASATVSMLRYLGAIGGTVILSFAMAPGVASPALALWAFGAALVLSALLGLMLPAAAGEPHRLR